MSETRIYEDIALRTNGDIYIGVVGPVRTGKSTFIKRFMETLVIPNIENVYVKERAKDELPQSGSGKTIMTAEPKFVPEDAVKITLDDNATFNVRMIDSVGYMIPSASGLFEGDSERMVTTPWFSHEIPITEAAETGTKKVITDHSTLGIVITTDGTVTNIPREDYISAEERVIKELLALNKPFLVIVNSADTQSGSAVAKEISEKYGVSCISKNCLSLNKDDITEIIECILSEFPITEIDIDLPSWIDGMSFEYELKNNLFNAIIKASDGINKLKDIKHLTNRLSEYDIISSINVTSTNMGNGICKIKVDIPQTLFYLTLSQNTGLQIENDRDLIEVLSELSKIKNDYERISPALEDVEKTGYGIIMPSKDAIILDDPEIIRKNGRYSVKLKASAKSIHLVKTDIETEVTPAVGGAGTSEEIIGLLLQDFEGDTTKIWNSNLFGKSLQDIAGDDLMNKILKMPNDTQQKVRDALQRIVNEGSNGIICIIL